MDVHDAPGQGSQAVQGDLVHLLDILGVLIEPLLQTALAAEDELLVHVVAIDVDIGLGVGLADQDHDPILQSHRQLDLILDRPHNLRVALHDHVVARLHIYHNYTRTAIELIEGVLELAEQGRMPTAQLLLDIGEQPCELLNWLQSVLGLVPGVRGFAGGGEMGVTHLG